MKARKAVIKEDTWYLLEVGASLYHMQNNEFCDNNGLYNLKFLSPDGKYEGVYVNSGGENQGKACTDETDSINMGSYNYEGRYKSDSSKVIGHALLDILPYGDGHMFNGNIVIPGKRWGNVSPEDYRDPIKEEKYENDSYADTRRQEFISDWGGR